MYIIYVFKLHHRIFWLKGTLSGSPVFNTQKMPKHSEAKRALQGHIAETKTIFLPSPTLLGAEGITQSKRDSLYPFRMLLHRVVSPHHRRCAKNTCTSSSQILFCEIVFHGN